MDISHQKIYISDAFWCIFWWTFNTKNLYTFTCAVSLKCVRLWTASPQRCTCMDVHGGVLGTMGSLRLVTLYCIPQRKHTPKTRTRRHLVYDGSHERRSIYFSRGYSPSLSSSCKYISRAARSGGRNEHWLAGSSAQKQVWNRSKEPRGVEKRKWISISRGRKMTHWGGGKISTSCGFIRERFYIKSAL